MEYRPSSKHQSIPCVSRSVTACFSGLIAFALVATLSILPAAGSGAHSPSPAWRILHSFEKEALRDYEFHVISNDVLQRGQILLQLSRSNIFSGPHRDCGRAAQTLSFMLVGYYQSSVKRQVATDWHYFSGDYRNYRQACLAALKLEPTAYPLPRWFGR